MRDEVELCVHGNDGQPPLIYLPGLHGDWTLVGSFRIAVAERLRFVEVVYPRTTAWSLDDYAREIESALLARGIANGWLLGESFGSQIAWKMSERTALGEESAAPAESSRARPNFQTDGLILAGGFVRHPVNWAVRLAGRVSRAVPLSIVKSCCCIYARYAKFRHRRAPETGANISEFVTRRTVAADRDAIAHRYPLMAQNDLRPIARRTRLPVFYLAGLVDPLVPWPFVRLWLRRHCPGYRGGKTIWGADHNVLGTAPRPAAEQIVQWIDSVREEQAATASVIFGTATAKVSAPR
ncbi:MAG: hypothetical protein DME26_16815 [Verrucomicrobia bacterium]|nr:MAG: hypothetical protein DME26_16815 [Verrucomicrobiota bacterium]